MPFPGQFTNAFFVLFVFPPFPSISYLLQTEAEKERTTPPGRMAARTAPKTTTPDMETTTATTTATNAKKKPPTPVPGTSKQSARQERRGRRRGEAIDAIRLLRDALPLASESTRSDADSDDCSTIGNTSTGESAMDTFQLPSARRQLKRKGSRNSSSVSDRRERPGTKPVTAGESQPVQSAPNQPKANDARVRSVVLPEETRWMAVNAELVQQGVRTTKVVKTNVGIRTQPASAADHRQLVRIVSAMKV
ncbi:hypothetical protein Trydic_g14257 [Trypoxylus dichotomus]